MQVVADGAREPDLPLITQVSRWDRLKDMTGVLDAVTEYVPNVHLALVGPDPTAITDDIEQHLWYTQCFERWKDLPSARRRQVSLICLPMTDPAHRRDFVKALAVGGTGAALGRIAPTMADDPPKEDPKPRSEVDARMDLILARYGQHLDDDGKKAHR